MKLQSRLRQAALGIRHQARRHHGGELVFEMGE